MTIERKLILAAALPVMFVMQLGSSCSSINDDDDRPVYRDDRPVYRDGPYHDDGYRDDDRPNRIPRWADSVREGTGKQRWTADFDGVVYVYDAKKDFVPWYGPVRRGQEIIVRPEDDRITVNDRAVYTNNLERDGRYTIYFAREGRQQAWERDHRDDHGGWDNNRDNDWNRPRNGNSGPIPPNRRPAGWPVGVPEDCELVQRGTGNLRLEQARRDGMVYVFDRQANRVIYSKDLRRGDRFEIFPGDDRVVINNKNAQGLKMPRDHEFQVYFRAR